MRPLDDRLSRISALRPPAGKTKPDTGGPETKSSSNRERILSLLQGNLEHNDRGSYVRVRRSFDEPVPGAFESRALELLLPGHSGEGCNPRKWLFLDTETTGLSGGTGTYAFLVGIGWWETDRFVVEQFFMRDHSEESSMLKGLLERIEDRPVLVTYNGKSFDWPLLETRFRMARAGTAPELAAHLDLLYPARRLWRLQLRSVALTQVETHVLGVARGRDIPSETIPQIYFNFLRGGSLQGIAEILNHNRMDLRGLARLALRVMRILENPEDGDCGACELFGVSRLLQQRGQTDRAECLYRKAVEKGLPEAAARLARKELALAAKRRSDFEEANALWEKLLGDTAEGLKAYEQLAIYYEHEAGEPRSAAHLSREAMRLLRQAYTGGRVPAPQYMRLYARLRHRLKRLASKLEPQNP